MKELFDIVNLLNGAGKKIIAVLLVVIPFASYIGATVYIRYKTDISTIQSLNSRFDNLENLVEESFFIQQSNKDSILKTIYSVDENRARQINTMQRSLVNEIGSQLKFIVQYQNQNTQMVLDHLDVWRSSYLLLDSLKIRVERR